ncbi:NADP-dependent oxidoreductase domain-containing protein [Rhizophagus diaphanus]|nr:NADP-dependent oxidoreductase domain-containing protein [Rhizophagus diaphanus] [Rhizophagus sp. MUCL 43196]
MLLCELNKTDNMIYTYGSADEQENIRGLNRAIDLGCTDIYNNGANEILLSKVLKDRHNELFFCKKFGIIRGPNGEISSTWTLDIETNGIMKACHELGVTIVAYSPLVKISIKFGNCSEKKGVTPDQLCLSWILAQGDNMIVIPGTRKIKHLGGNVEAVKVNLSSEELDEIRQIINSIEIIGNRCNDIFMKVGNHNYL